MLQASVVRTSSRMPPRKSTPKLSPKVKNRITESVTRAPENSMQMLRLPMKSSLGVVVIRWIKAMVPASPRSAELWGAGGAAKGRSAGG